MLERPISELQFLNSQEPLPTVEVDIDSIPGHYYGYDDIVADALAPFAKDNPSRRVTVYTYQGPSTNFRHQTFSAFFGVDGPKEILEILLAAFKRIPGVNARTSDYISGSSGICEFHLQNGSVWRASDALSWYTKSAKSATPTNSDYGEDWEEPDPEPSPDHQVLKSTGTRFRQARSDASIESIQKSIEQVYGLPEGSVTLCGPDGRRLRSDAKICTLRKQWE